MTEMTDRELASLIDEAERDSVTHSGSFNSDNEKQFDYYMGEPFGDELEGRSQVVSTDMADLVEADMPSLARVFLGGNQIAEFKPTKPQDVSEAEEKNIYIPYIIRNVKDSFRIQHGWLKNSLMQKLAVLEYGLRDERKTTVKKYTGLSELELIQLVQELQGDSDVSGVEIIGQDIVDDGEGAMYSVDIRVTTGEQTWFMANIPNEDVVISRNVESKHDADIVGKRFRKSRGDLIADGFDEDLVRSLPTESTDEESSAKQKRYRVQGGEDLSSGFNDWPNEMVEGLDVYVRVDYDGDGILERRHVIKVGGEILVNEPFDHVPYAITSSILMPNNLVGRSRGELTLTTQRVQSVLTRNVLDNIYSVNNPGMVVNDSVIEMDDLLTQRPNRIIRSEGQPVGQWQPLETPYIGDKALQVIQYMDSKQARSTGALMSSQGLDADTLHKETATRFSGVKDERLAKIELVARVLAETGYRDLYEGLAWFASHFQDEPKEIFVMGQPLTVNPQNWKFDNHIEALVGTGAGDDEKTLETLSGIYQLQQQLSQTNPELTDSKKIYNTTDRIVKASGLHRTERYFNDPERPDQLLLAENEQLKQIVQQLQVQAQENPLADAEKIRAQASLLIAESKKQEANQKDQLQVMKMRQDMQQFLLTMKQNQNQFDQDLIKELTEMELKYGENVPGALV